METNRLDIVPGKIAPVIHTSQYDVGRVFRFYLYDGTSQFTLTGSETVTCSIRKTDGNIVILSVENTADNYVDVVTTEQSTACAGQNICELRIEDGEINIGTMDFILQVESDPTEGGIASATEINNLRTQVSELVGDFLADQYDADAVVFDNAPTAGHGIGFAVTSEGIKTAIKEATTPTGEVSGDIVTFDDALNGVPFIEVEAQIEATQSGSGTPSPDNNRPINGFDTVIVQNTGKNLLDIGTSTTTNGGVTFTIANGVISLSGTATGSYANCNLPSFFAKDGIKYSLSGGLSANIFIRDTTVGQNDQGNGITFTGADNAHTLSLRVLGGTDTTGIVIKPQIELGESKTAFVPYKGSTHTIDLGQTVGKGVLNVTTGVLTINSIIVRRAVADMDNGESYPGWKNVDLTPYGYSGGGNIGNTRLSVGSQFYFNFNNQTVVFLNTNTYGLTQSQWKAQYPDLIIDIEVPVRLATPLTVQLTPEEVKTISGLNTVSANSGDIRVVYRKDFGIFADAIPYDNADSGLTADNVQDAIDEVADNTYTKTETDALLADKADTASLATVATSGAYSDLTGKPTVPTIDSVTPPNQMTVGSTYQLPASVFAHSLIVLTARRYGYVGEATLTRSSIIGGTATQGIYCPYSATTGWLFTIDASGLLTYKQAVGSSPDPTVEIVGIF